ncbi:hypothetical protein RJT34_03657 [Clitoria ternatea]|uniref:Ubiquitin-like domain-containing protein n=1 Tax=Clitoria ternatea TaxID=43366 RepID=A0AAN9Q5A5_CLITE
MAANYDQRKSIDNAATEITSVNFAIRDQEGRRLFFRVKENIQFRKVFKDFCDKRNFDYEVMRFIYDGHYVNGKQTPKTLNIENGEEILATIQQTGGGVADINF